MNITKRIAYPALATTICIVTSSTATTAGTGEVKVSGDVTNTGDRLGDEVVQFYLRNEIASITPLNKALKGFQRVNLSPGEKKTATVTIPAMDLSLIDRKMKRVIEPGHFGVIIGRNGDEETLRGGFDVNSQ